MAAPRSLAYYRATTDDPALQVQAGDLFRFDPATGKVVQFRCLRGGWQSLAAMVLAGKARTEHYDGTIEVEQEATPRLGRRGARVLAFPGPRQ